jgi:hypothetical protein
MPPDANAVRDLMKQKLLGVFSEHDKPAQLEPVRMERRRLSVLKLDAERTRSFSNAETFMDMISMTGSRQNMS